MNPTDAVSRRDYLKLTSGVVAGSTAGLSGCLGGNGGDGAETGTLGTQITDQPGDIADFDSCVVTIQGIWVKPHDEAESNEDDSAGDEENSTEPGNETDADGTDVDESEGREYHEFDEPQEADLVDLQGDNTQLIDERELTAQEYEFLQLDVSDVTGELKEGGDAEVSTPGNAPLQFTERFEVRPDQRTTFVGDFTPVRRGQQDRYLLQPVAQGTRVVYEDEADEADEANETTETSNDTNESETDA